MLAWLMAAPLRSTVKEFPYLNITGEYGTGKSGFLEKYIPVITGCSRIMALGTKPTSYAMSSLASSSNAFPIMFDEYRTNSSITTKDTLEQMDNIIRASWNAGVRETGGHPLDPKRIMRLPISAPLIVAGEVEQATGSTRQRMVPIYLIRDERGDDSAILPYVGVDSDVAALYLEWLNMRQRTLETYERGPHGLDVRMRYTIGYLEQGWDLLNWWLEDLGYPLVGVDLDLSTVIATFQHNEEDHPLLSAIAAVMADHANRSDQAVWVEDDVVLIKPSSFAKAARMLDIDVGNAQTIGRTLTQVLGAGTRKVNNGTVRLRTLPIDVVS